MNRRNTNPKQTTIPMPSDTVCSCANKLNKQAAWIKHGGRKPTITMSSGTFPGSATLEIRLARFGPEIKLLNTPSRYKPDLHSYGTFTYAIENNKLIITDTNVIDDMYLAPAVERLTEVLKISCDID